MTLALGTVPAGTTIYIPFATFAGATGASITLTGLAVTDIEIYKNGSVTQRSSDAGYALLDTDGIDFDGITGIHGFSVDLADNTDSGFYAVGSQYWVVVSAVTIDSQTVNFIAAVFRIGPAESVAGYPKADVSHFGGAAGTFSSGRPEVNTTHAAGTAWNSGAIGANTLAAGTITDAKVASDVTIASVTGAVGSVTGAVGSVTGNVGGNVVGSVASVTAAVTVTGDLSATMKASVNAEVDTAIADAALATAANLATVAGYLDTEIAAILADTNELQTDWANGGRLDLILDARASQASVDTIDGIVDSILVDTAEIGAAGAGLTAVPWNAAWDAEVQSEVADALGVYDPPTNAEMVARTLAAADYATATALATVDTVADSIKVTTDKLDDTLEDDAGTFRFTANALEQAPSGTGASAQSIVEAMFQNDSGETAASAVAGSPVYEIVQNAGGGSAPTAAEVADEVQTRTIAAVTLVNGLAANSVTAAALAGDAGTEIGTAVWASATRTLTALDEDNTTLDLDATIRGAVGLGSANLDTQLADLPTNAELATAIGTGDDAVLAVLGAPVGASLSADIAAVAAKTGNLPSDPADQSLIIAATDAVMARLGAPAGANISADIAATKVDTAAIKVKTDFLPSATAGAAGGLFIAGSNAATTVSLTGDITGNLSGSVGSVTGSVGGNVAGSIGSLAAQAKADVNAEVVDTLATDAYGEPGQGSPAVSLSLSAKVGYLYKAFRNRSTQTSSEYALYADDGTTKDHAAVVSDDGTTFVRGELTTGA